MEKSKKIVLFDIDYTVFNTNVFRSNLYPLLAEKFGFSDLSLFIELAKEVGKETKEKIGYFNPETFLKLLKEKSKKDVPISELEDIFFDETLYIESLYEDARSVFQELVMKRDIQINIFSTGDKKFQMRKIAILKDMLHDDNLHIFVDKLKRLKDVLQQYEEYHIYMVDDLPTVLKEAKSFDKNITTIWMNRDKKLNEQDFVTNFKADYVVKNLEEIIPLVIKK
jgi:hypothetical protein